MKHIVKLTHPSSRDLTPNSEGDKCALHSNALEDNLEIAACANGKGDLQRGDKLIEKECMDFLNIKGSLKIAVMLKALNTLGPI